MSTSVTTPKFRVSYCHVFKPHAFVNQEAKYSLCMIFDKNTDLTPLKKAAQAAAIKKWGEDKSKWPKGMRSAFRDGNERGTPEFEGKIFVNATSKTRPGVVGPTLSPIVEEDGLFYSGCFARATLNAFAYDNMGNRGISFGLNNIQKLADGERLGGGRRAAADDFDKVEDTSEDKSAYEENDLGF